MYEFTREIQGNGAYLVLRLQSTDIMDDLALGMLGNNRISGILPMTKRWEKQGFALYYTISSLTPMAHCAGLFGDERRVIQLLRSYCHVLMEGEEYLLDQSGLLLDPEYVFVRAATGDISLCYLPIRDCQANAGTKAFLDQMIRSAVRELPQDSSLVNVLLRENIQEEFVPQELLERLDGLHPQGWSVPRSKPQPEDMEQPAQLWQEKQPLQQDRQEPSKHEPTSWPKPEPQPEKQPEEPEEKHRLFGFGAKKDASKKKRPKKELGRRVDEDEFDNPFAIGDKIPPHGSVSAEPEVGLEEAEPHRGGLSSLFGRNRDRSHDQKRESSKENDEANPFVQEMEPKAEAVRHEPVAQVSGGCGYTVDLRTVAHTGSSNTVAMGQNSGLESGNQSADFPVIWLEEKKSGNRVRITHDNFHVGRKRGTDDIVDYAVLTATPYMGSDHCYFVCHGSQMFVVDNNSRNGTWVNEIRITPGTEVPIEPGTVIRMADVTFIVR